ncbi:hypothetical protein OEZ86_014118 [Tetradesmus obliquus]|nr:hypothetical protein OEZ86_014118 [Tetradesmus obliquus]
MELQQARDDCQRHKCKVHQKVEQLQHQRQQQLAPSRLYLPPPWQPAVFKQPTPQFMVLAAEGCSFVALHDSRLQFTPQRWTYGPADCRGAWPPLRACMRTYTTAAQAMAAASSQRGSSNAKGARVLARVLVKGRGYTHADSGCVAVPSLLFDAVLEYVPQTPKERLMAVDYGCGGLQAGAAV